MRNIPRLLSKIIIMSYSALQNLETIVIFSPGNINDYQWIVFLLLCLILEPFCFSCKGISFSSKSRLRSDSYFMIFGIVFVRILLVIRVY